VNAPVDEKKGIFAVAQAARLSSFRRVAFSLLLSVAANPADSTPRQVLWHVIKRDPYAVNNDDANLSEICGPIAVLAGGCG